MDYGMWTLIRLRNECRNRNARISGKKESRTKGRWTKGRRTKRRRTKRRWTKRRWTKRREMHGGQKVDMYQYQGSKLTGARVPEAPRFCSGHRDF